MKSVTTATAATPAGASSGTAGPLNTVANGRVHRQRRDVENEEIQMYLSKLKELVPFMPKNRRLSKLEVIQHVIDYICDLQYALETHPVAAAAAAVDGARQPQQRGGALPPAPARQPLGVIAPNANVGVAVNATCAAQDLLHAATAPVHLDKATPVDSRPVSC
ncbi:protein extra-macrochaetae-like [Schistocerca americana]|uniref:protein extra-macrochaetae-like n=1 Tax=Schistocerca americana TaxID=7009 RepID=UPI001F4F2F0C|nr:protein extra-macrochaetae-like [Schistocerca americana]XP_047111073.1 protein extra-macrochaetae-like [Schistocerca piceifrons]XP_049956657.1 protein extra-macrochaetae-like [Schistocerca serialis cubense]